MTFKRRLWNTIALTILIFVLRFHSSAFLVDLDFYFSFPEIERINNLSLLVVFIPFFLFIIQLIFHYLFKRNYPVQDRKIKYPILRMLVWVIILVPIVLYYFLDYQERRMHSGGGYIGAMKIASGILYLMPFYWIWVIKELKDNYGTKMGLCSFLFTLIGLFFYITFSTPCPKDKPLMGYYGCYSCDEWETVTMNRPENCTTVCPNRFLDKQECYFSIKSCPQDAPLKRIGRDVVVGKNFEQAEPDCYRCDEIKYLKVSNCQDCPNREMKDGFCILKNCPEQFPLRDKNNGKCISCDTLEGVNVDNCEVCSNREYWPLSDYKNCFLKECPSDAPIRDIDRECRKCDDNIAFEPEDDEDCSRLCPKERMLIVDEYIPSKQKCGLINCPEGMDRHERGSCFKFKR